MLLSYLPPLGRPLRPKVRGMERERLFACEAVSDPSDHLAPGRADGARQGGDRVAWE